MNLSEFHQGQLTDSSLNPTQNSRRGSHAWLCRLTGFNPFREHTWQQLSASSVPSQNWLMWILTTSNTAPHGLIYTSTEPRGARNYSPKMVKRNQFEGLCFGFGVCFLLFCFLVVVLSLNFLFCILAIVCFVKLLNCFFSPCLLNIWQLLEIHLPQCSNPVEYHLADHPWTSQQLSGDYKGRKNEKALPFIFLPRPHVSGRKNPASQSLPLHP